MIENFHPPTSYEEANKIATMEPVYYEEYKRLGGKLSKEDYVIVSSMFFWYTYEAAMGDSWLYHGKRDSSFNKFRVWLKHMCPGEKANTIYQSIDNVHAYT